MLIQPFSGFLETLVSLRGEDWIASWILATKLDPAYATRQAVAELAIARWEHYAEGLRLALELPSMAYLRGRLDADDPQWDKKCFLGLYLELRSELAVYCLDTLGQGGMQELRSFWNLGEKLIGFSAEPRRPALSTSLRQLRVPLLAEVSVARAAQSAGYAVEMATPDEDQAGIDVWLQKHTKAPSAFQVKCLKVPGLTYVYSPYENDPPEDPVRLAVWNNWRRREEGQQCPTYLVVVPVGTFDTSTGEPERALIGAVRDFLETERVRLDPRVLGDVPRIRQRRRTRGSLRRESRLAC